MASVYMTGVGVALPSNVVSNDWFEENLDTTAQWILQRTGIRERRVIDDEKETLQDLALAAAIDALGESSVKADLVVVASSTPSDAFGDASRVATKLYELGKATVDCAGLDVRSACTGFVDAVAVASKMCKRKAVVIGADSLASSLVDWSDRSTCCLFGDAAGAIVLEKRIGQEEVVMTLLRGYNDGTYAGDALVAPRKQDKDNFLAYDAIRMRGSEVFQFASEAAPQAIEAALEQARWSKESVARFCVHQANDRITRNIAEALGLPPSKVPSTIEKIGNVGAASVPTALLWGGPLRPGDRLVLAAFGAGPRSAVVTLRYGGPGSSIDNNYANVVSPDRSPFKMVDLDFQGGDTRQRVRSALADIFELDDITSDQIDDLAPDSLSALDLVRHFPGLDPTVLLTSDTISDIVRAVDDLSSSSKATTSSITKEEKSTSDDDDDDEAYEEESFFEVTPLQHAMLFHHLRSPGYFTISFGWTLAPGAWSDAEKFTRAVSAVVERHEALRSSFSFRDGDWPTQRVHHDLRASLKVTTDDDDSLSDDVIAKRQRVAVTEDLDAGRPALFRIAKRQRRLVATFHHLVIDGLSLRIVLRDLDEAYRGQLLGGGAPRWRSFAKKNRRQRQDHHTDESAVWTFDAEASVRRCSRRVAGLVPALEAFAKRHCRNGSLAALGHAAFVVAARAAGFEEALGSAYDATFALRRDDVVGPALATRDVRVPEIKAFATFAATANAVDGLLLSAQRSLHGQEEEEEDLMKTRRPSLLFDFQGGRETWLGLRSVLEDGAILDDRAGSPVSVRCVRSGDDLLLTAVAETRDAPRDATSKLVDAMATCVEALATLSIEDDKPLDLLTFAVRAAAQSKNDKSSRVVVAAGAASVEAAAATKKERASPATTSTESAICEAAKAVLGVDAVSPLANLFSIGVDSLKAMRLVSRAVVDFGAPRSLTLRRLFEAPIPRDLALLVDKLVDDLDDDDDQDETLRSKDAKTLASVGAETPFDLVDHDPERDDTMIPLFGVGAAHFVGLHASTYAAADEAIAPQIAWEWRFKDFDASAFLGAWELLLLRHPTLRAQLSTEGHLAVLGAAATKGKLSFRHQDDNKGTLAAQREFFESGSAIGSVFDWPLFAFGHFEDNSNETIVHVAISLFLMDAVSDVTFRFELSEAYEAFKARKEVHLAAASTLSFGRYSRAMVERLPQSKAYAKARAFWDAKLKDPSTPRDGPALAQLTHSHRSTASSSSGPKFRNVAVDFDKDEWTALKQSCAANGTTVPAALLTAYALALRRHSERGRFLLNVLLCVRYAVHADVLRTIGNASSTVVVDVDLEDVAHLAEATFKIAASLAASLEHAAMSGTEVMAAVNRDRGTSFEVVAPAIFTTPIGVEDHVGDVAARTRNWSFRETRFSERVPHSACVNAVKDDPVTGGARLSFDVVDGAFPPSLFDSVVDTYAALLQQGFCNLDKPWADLHWKKMSLRPPPSLLIGVGAPVEESKTLSVGPPRLLHEPLFRREDSAAPFVVYENDDGVGLSTLSYAQVAGRARHLAVRLVPRLASAREKLVAVVMAKGWRQVVATHGILLSGAAYLPMDAMLWPEKRVEVVLASSGAEVCVADERGRPLLPLKHDAVFGVVEETDYYAKNGVVFPPRRSPSEPAYVIYTSGSTGTPKGVVCHHAGAANTIDDLVDRWKLGPSDVILGLSSLAFDLSVFDIFGAAAAGATLVIPSAEAVVPPDPSRWVDLAATAGVTLWNSVPALLEVAVLEVDLKKRRTQGGSPLFEKLRVVFVSGDVVPPDLPKKTRKSLGVDHFVIMGGATECAIWSNEFVVAPSSDLPGPSWTSWPYGRPLKNQSLEILDDETLEPLPVWTTGPIYIGGLGVAQGYKNDAEKTAAQFITRKGELLFRTGDLGRLRECDDGWLVEILGREDAQVKIRGNRVELTEVESAILTTTNAIRSVACAAHQGNLYAFVVVVDAENDAALFDASGLRDRLANLLPIYMLPTKIIQVDALPLSSNGKVQRNKLVVYIDDATTTTTTNRTRNDEIVSPATETQSRLRDAFALVVDSDAICCETSDFFRDLGGSSMAGLRLLNKLNQTFTCGRPLSVRDLLGNPTVSKLAAIVDARRADTSDAKGTTSSSEEKIQPLLLAPFDSKVLLLCNPAGASGLTYVAFANELAKVGDCGVVALDDGVVGGRRPSLGFLSIAEAALAVASAARHFLARGRRVYLGGWSLGGVLALEAAASLEKGSLAGVVLVDAPLLGSVVEEAPTFDDKAAERHFHDATTILKDYYKQGAAINCRLDCDVLHLVANNNPATTVPPHLRLTARTMHHADHWSMLHRHHAPDAAKLVAAWMEDHDTE